MAASNSSTPNVYAKIAQPSLDILDIMALYQRELSWTVTTTSGPAAGTITAARVPAKPFIVGFIPPDITVNFVPIEKAQNSNTTVATLATPQAIPQPAAKGSPSQAIIYPPAFYQQLQTVANNIGARPEDLMAVMMKESGMNPAATNGDPPVARGLIQWQQNGAMASGMTASYYQNNLSSSTASQQLPYVQNYYAGKGVSSYPTAGSLYLANAAPAYMSQAGNSNFVLYPAGSGGATGNPSLAGSKGYVTVGDLDNAMNDVKQTTAYQQQIAAYTAATGQQIPDPTIPDPNATPPTTTSIMSNGTVTTADTADPLSDQLGRNIRISDTRAAVVQKQTNDLNYQIQLIQSTPALVMLINPSEFTRSYEHTVDPVKSRSGFVINMWLERPPSISCKGTTAGQYFFRSDGSGGLTNFNRVQSISYKNLMSLVSIYRNNGYTYMNPAISADNAGVPLVPVSCFIYYDNHLYIGSFDEFTVTDDGNKPFTLSYNWKFTVRYDVDTTSVADALISQSGQVRAG